MKIENTQRTKRPLSPKGSLTNYLLNSLLFFDCICICILYRKSCKQFFSSDSHFYYWQSEPLLLSLEDKNVYGSYFGIKSVLFHSLLNLYFIFESQKISLLYQIYTYHRDINRNIIHESRKISCVHKKYYDLNITYLWCHV